MSKKVGQGSTASDAAPLVTVEDLINRALGPEQTNQVDFKLLQAILQIFARQQRLLQQRVQLRFSERTKPKRKKEKKSKSRGTASVEFDDDDDDDDLGKGSSGLEISETVRDKERVLVVDRGPPSPGTPKTPRDEGAGSPRRGPIPVVTQRQLAAVEASVEQLAGTRRDDADVAQRLSARVKAAEAAVGRLVDVLGRLADAGALPPDLRAAVGDVHAEWGARTGAEPRRRRSSSFASAPPCVTRADLDEVLSEAVGELTRAVRDGTARAAESAEWALRKAQAVGEKMERASSLNVRLSTLQALVEDYFQQIGGFETGLTTQIRQFQEQIEQIDADLGAGLQQLKHVNNNTETAAVVALTERYEELVVQLEGTVHDHTSLAAGQARLARDIHNLSQALENLKEQKCDRAEVVDGLRDKATTYQLRGLLREEQFEATRDVLQARLTAFHDLFHEQENRWMEALKDLSERADAKAQWVELARARDEAQAQLRAVDERLRSLAAAVGEPQVAFLTRALLADMRCASCREPAPLEARSAAPRPPAPRPLPARGASDGESDSPRRHACRRWCGGSHTLLSAGVTRAPAPPPPAAAAGRRHTGYGRDGRLYQMQEDCQPCLACDKLDAATSSAGRGAGDQQDG